MGTICEWPSQVWAEADFTELADAVLLAGGNHKILGLLLLQHEPPAGPGRGGEVIRV